MFITPVKAVHNVSASFMDGYPPEYHNIEVDFQWPTCILVSNVELEFIEGCWFGREGELAYYYD
jgi:hypothetical protein